MGGRRSQLQVSRDLRHQPERPHGAGRRSDQRRRQPESSSDPKVGDGLGGRALDPQLLSSLPKAEPWGSSMLTSHRARSTFAAAAVLLASASACVNAQTIQPTNDGPNPYRTVEGWAKMPAGRTWGSTSAVEIDKDGTSIWVAERCGANSCLGSMLDPILKFDANGNLVKSFGAGLLIFPHGIHVDPDGNIWVTDGQDNLPRRGRGQPNDAPLPPPPANVVGHQVYKFSPEGKLLLTLGKTGGAREPEFFYQPNDILVAPNGEIFVAEGHSSAPTANARILKFSKDGKLIKTIGKKGTGPVEFDQPHALAMDSRGRLFVGDRSNNRIQILDQEGNFIAEWA